MRIFIAIFSILWMLVVFIDYLNKHPIHFMSVNMFRFGGFLASLFILTGIIAIANQVFFKPEKNNFRIYNGLGIMLLGAIIGILSLLFYTNVVGLKTDIAGSFIPVFKAIVSLLAILVLFCSCLAWGKLLEKVMHLKLDKSANLIRVASGVMSLTMLMFILGVIKFLNFVSLGILMLVPLIMEYKQVSKFLKSCFLSDISKTGFIENKIIPVAIALITVVSINILYIQIPFPPGFDSRNFYMNISQLIGQQQGLISGFQPYNWSLFMSYGFVMFKSSEIAFSTSLFGFLLSLWAGYELMKNYLNLSSFNSLLVLTLFSVTPSVTNQLFIELKVDFGLLFMQLASVMILLQLYSNKSKEWSKKEWRLMVLLGLISGFALGIKLTHVYLLFGIVAFIWYRHAGIKGFMAMLSIILFVILLSKIDDLSGLSKYHLGAGIFKWFLLLLGLAITILIFRENKTTLVSAIKSSAVITVFSLLCFGPWMVKNVINQKGQISMESILIGSNPGPEINLKIIEENYYRNRNKNKNKKNNN